ncbi:MAG: NHL repeat-containing protein [Ktedonobacterales bacterium]
MPRIALSKNGALRTWALALIAGAALCCLLAPPLVAFRPQPLPALGGVAAGGVILLWPLVRPLRSGWTGWGLAAGGALFLWGIIAWCILSQVAPITQPISFTWGLRGLPIVVAAAMWLWLMLSRDWQRRTLLAVALPSTVGLGLVAWNSSTLQLVNFQPYYVAVDSHGTIYVTDAASPVIRIFGPGGSLRAKLRPGLASRQGPPGPGFSQPGPYNDPERLGVPRAASGSTSVSGSLRPWAPGTDDFWFCGMALDSHDNLYVPDWMHSRMLRFAPNGQLIARGPLPQDFHPSLGCITTGPDDALYLSDEHGVILRLDANGHVLAHWALPEAIVGGISISPDGRTVNALALTRVYQVELGGGVIRSWPLPTPTGSLGRPYQGILATTGGRVLVTNLTAHRVDVYCTGVTGVGRECGHIGSGGIWPGQFGQVGGMARDNRGDLYVADFDHRVLQQFTSDGTLDALYWGPDDDEVD